jgi:hypothetical protein
MSQDPNNTNENMEGQGQQQASQWSQMIGQALESITGKNMSTTVRFHSTTWAVMLLKPS